MFSKATAAFVRQIDPEGTLNSVSRLNDSKKLVLMAVVVKRNRWLWQSPKYRTTDYTLQDLLQGDELLNPEISEGEFGTFQGTYKDTHAGKLNGEAGAVSVSLQGGVTSKLQSCFGKLMRQDLAMKELELNARNRLVDMNHPLVEQLEKRADVVLALVMERIFTADPCSITQTNNQQCNFKGILAMLGIRLGLTESNNMVLDSDVSLEIPSGTVIAYSVRELEIKKDGNYRICVQPDTTGGIESDSPNDMPTAASFEVDGKINGSDDHTVLSSLAELPQQTRSNLFEELQKTLKDRTALSQMECKLEGWCSRAELNGAGSEYNAENSQSDSPALIDAAHLLVSALEELPDQTLNILSKSSPDFIEAFNTLMSSLKTDSEHLSVHSLPVPLEDKQSFQLAEKLLGSIAVTLKRDDDWLWTETGDKAGVLPLVLSLSTHGLSLLCKG